MCNELQCIKLNSVSTMISGSLIGFLCSQSDAYTRCKRNNIKRLFYYKLNCFHTIRIVFLNWYVEFIVNKTGWIPFE